MTVLYHSAPAFGVNCALLWCAGSELLGGLRAIIQLSQSPPTLIGSWLRGPCAPEWPQCG